MPMQFSQSTFLEMLLSSRNILTRWQISDNLFPSPTTIEDFGFRIAETPLEVDDRPSVGTLLSEIVWVLEVELVVGAAFIQTFC